MEEFTSKDCSMPVGTKTGIKISHKDHTVYTAEELAKFNVTCKDDDAKDVGFPGIFAKKNPDFGVEPGYYVKIINHHVQGALLLNKGGADSINLNVGKITLGCSNLAG